MDRRDFIKTTSAAAAVGRTFLSGAPAISRQPDLIKYENAKPGASFQLTRMKPDDAKSYRTSLIEGYCSRQSVKAGEKLDIFVSTKPSSKFIIEIFRMGYYDGMGSRLMSTLGPFEGQAQPVPEMGEDRLRECLWEASTSIIIPADWPSGVYLGRLTTMPEVRSSGFSPSPERPEGRTTNEEPYWQSYVIFIVKDDRPADILFQCSDNTWQAYNRWPNNYSIYTHPKGVQGPWAQVSFDRPYGRESQFAGIVNDPLTMGSGEFLPFEFPLAYWMEQHGYDVTYCANADLLTPDRALKCKSFLSVGHDEYWDIRAFRSVEKLRDAGVDLLFFSGNSICWVTPMTPSADGRENRRMYRGGPYGADNDYAKNRQKDNGPFPEHGPDEGLLMGARNVDPVNGGGDWICTKPGHWIFEGTGMKQGDAIPGLIGWEYHGQPATEIPGLEVVGGGTAWQGGTRPQQWTATIYPGPKGNFVFNASSIFWAQGLSTPPGHILPWSHWSRPHGPDDRVQRITRNLFERVLNRAK